MKLQYCSVSPKNVIAKRSKKNRSDFAPFQRSLKLLRIVQPSCDQDSDVMKLYIWNYWSKSAFIDTNIADGGSMELSQMLYRSGG